MYNFNFSFHISPCHLSVFAKIRLPDIPKDIPRHIPIPIPAILFNTFTKTTLQSIAIITPIINPIIILLFFINFIPPNVDLKISSYLQQTSIDFLILILKHIKYHLINSIVFVQKFFHRFCCNFSRSLLRKSKDTR